MKALKGNAIPINKCLCDCGNVEGYDVTAGNSFKTSIEKKSFILTELILSKRGPVGAVPHSSSQENLTVRLP